MSNESLKKANRDLNLEISKKLQEAANTWKKAQGKGNYVSDPKLAEAIQQDTGIAIDGRTVQKHLSGVNEQSVPLPLLRWYSQTFGVSLDYLITGEQGVFEQGDKQSARTVLNALRFVCEAFEDNMEFQIVPCDRLQLDPYKALAFGLDYFEQKQVETRAIVFKDKCVQEFLSQLEVQQKQTVSRLGTAILDGTIRGIVQTQGDDIVRGCICDKEKAPVFFGRYNREIDAVDDANKDCISRNEFAELFLNMSDEDLLEEFERVENYGDFETNLFFGGNLYPQPYVSVLLLIIQEMQSRLLVHKVKENGTKEKPLDVSNYVETLSKMTREDCKEAFKTMIAEKDKAE